MTMNNGIKRNEKFIFNLDGTSNHMPDLKLGWDFYVKEFKNSWKILKETQKRKNKSLSSYDLSYGYDWKFYTKKGGLMRGHVYWDLNFLRYFRPKIKKINPQQMELF